MSLYDEFMRHEFMETTCAAGKFKPQKKLV